MTDAPQLITPQDWLNAWLDDQDLRPPQGDMAPTEFGYRIPQAGVVEFYGTFVDADGQPLTVSAVRNAADFGLQTMADGGLDSVGGPPA
ncbi:hypothetical protein GCM10023196_037370 [Actinoallomurus vinaceus]|uniref:Uncharacterized protein n=1 Tax=Actinoallomurus vinaceus TaxID=1080074 RepID=A0ABP8UD11_9ACTN